MSEGKWIKVVVDVFDDEKMLLIESLPNHDSILVIWFKLLCLAGKQNNGGVFMVNSKIAYTAEMLATIMHRPINLVKKAIQVFEEYGMIEVTDGVISITNWGKHQSLEYEQQRREYMKNYMSRKRKKNVNVNLNSVNNVNNVNVNKVNNVNSALADVNTLEKEIEKEKEITTTTIKHTHAYAQEGETLDEELAVDMNSEIPPTFIAVKRYFEENFHDVPTNEAEKFCAFNAMHDWDVMPDWQKAADLWGARIGDR